MFEKWNYLFFTKKILIKIQAWFFRSANWLCNECWANFPYLVLGAPSQMLSRVEILIDLHKIIIQEKQFFNPFLSIFTGKTILWNAEDLSVIKLDVFCPTYETSTWRFFRDLFFWEINQLVPLYRIVVFSRCNFHLSTRKIWKSSQW